MANSLEIVIARHLLPKRLSIRCGLAVGAMFLISFVAGAAAPSGLKGHTMFASLPDVARMAGDEGVLYHVLKQNLLVLGQIWGGVVTAGFTSLLQVAWNGFQAGLLLRQSDLRTYVVLVLPHAVLEFFAFILGATISVWLAWRTLGDAMAGEFHPVRHVRKVIPYAGLCVLLIFLAAIIEVYVTPNLGIRILSK